MLREDQGSLQCKCQRLPLTFSFPPLFVQLPRRAHVSTQRRDSRLLIWEKLKCLNHNHSVAVGGGGSLEEMQTYNFQQKHHIKQPGSRRTVGNDAVVPGIFYF